MSFFLNYFGYCFFRYMVDDDNSLKIKKLTMDDSAMFQCLASNEAGEKSSYTWLRVKSKYTFRLICSNTIKLQI